MLAIDPLLTQARDKEASDLHLQAGLCPRLRIHGDLHELKEHGPISGEQLAALISSMLREDQGERLESQRYFDYSHQDEAGCRWRCHAFYQHHGLSAAFRRLGGGAPTLAELNLPKEIERFADFRSGLALVTGATGSGKSTTLAAIINLINRKYRKHIVTLEDPIEYVFNDAKSMIAQREVGTHVDSFDRGLEDALAQGPDVLVVGELREYQTVRLALSAAETGTLVFATLHSNNSVETIHRMVDVFPADEQPLARAMISQSIEGVVSQVLLPTRSGKSRVPACELLFHSPAMANLIREKKIHELPSCIQTGGSLGMRLLDDSLHDLVRAGKITRKQAAAVARNRERFGD